MKINDVEQILGITKANIRFYEKEGLLTPGRTENGYRDYTESDVTRLKEIVIYRKLSIPVQQIADILDGVISLQDALDVNITALNEEIEKLNGSLALCQQLKAEDANVLDTERYWDIIQGKEQEGFRFQSLTKDYMEFMKPVTDLYLLHVPARHERNPRMIIKYTAIFALILGAINSLFSGDALGSFSRSFGGRFILAPLGFLMWCVLYIPAYLVGKKYPRVGKVLKVVITVAVILAAVLYFAWAVFGPEYT